MEKHLGYSVSVNSLLTNAAVWRAITNGYPYKTPAQLGCNSAEEAFVATKQAVYCILYGRGTEGYEAMNASGQRVKNALVQIVNAARNGSETKLSSTIEVVAQGNGLDTDILDKTYVSQVFTVNASISGSNCNLSLKGSYPEGTKITNLSNQTISSIVSGNQFKILVPIRTLKQDGTFEICAESKLETKPILYGRAPNGNLQDYALAGVSYEDAIGSRTLTYKANNTKLIIEKKEDETKLPMQGVEFRILDENKKEVYTNLVTDSNGLITINQLLPGMYYVEEVRTKEGYVRYEDLIKIALSLNESATVTVTNSKENSFVFTSNKSNISVNNSKQELNVSNENVNINKNGLDVDIDINNKNVNINENNLEADINIKNSNINNNTNVVKLPKTGM